MLCRILREAAWFTAGLILAVLFAFAAVGAFGLTVLLVNDAIESKGDPEAFEAAMRHRTDHFASDGSWRIERAAHPIAQHLGLMLSFWLLTIGLGWAVQKAGMRFRAARGVK